MDKDRIKGKLDDVAGRIKRQAGEWTGNKDLQTEGVKDQAKGKAEDTLGKIKDAARKLKEDLSNKANHEDIERDIDDKNKDVA